MSMATSREDLYDSGAFQKFPLAIEKGRGARVWDAGGREYLDFMTGYGVALIGHCNKVVVEAIQNQAEKLITCHGSFYNESRAEFLEKLAEVSPKGLDRAILTNSGAETVEAALKLARRASGKKKFVSMKGGFHGKTFGALSATWNRKYRDPFVPLLADVEFADYGSIESLESAADSDTAAVIVEPIQGESGVIVPSRDYFVGVRELCDRAGVLLIMDEIQSGLGRTGKMWASEHWGVVPDIMTVSKGLGGGVPIGAALSTSEIVGKLKRGEHTSTFGGNPLSCAAGSATLGYIKDHRLPEMAALKGAIVKDGLERIARDHKIPREVRGLGLMLALETRIDIHHLLLDSINRGALFAYSGRETIRLLPPLVINEEEAMQGLKILEDSIVEEEKRRFA